MLGTFARLSEPLAEDGRWDGWLAAHFARGFLYLQSSDAGVPDASVSIAAAIVDLQLVN